jgi:hypothetical protein
MLSCIRRGAQRTRSVELPGAYNRPASGGLWEQGRTGRRKWSLKKFHKFHITMALSQYVSVSLSLLGLVGLTGAGVAVGSGIGLMSLEMANSEVDSTSFAAASPVEKKN